MANSEKSKLESIKKQFGRTWEIFAAGWWKFLIILGLPYLAYIIIFLFLSRLPAASGNGLFALGLGYFLITAILAYVAFYLIATAGMIYGLDRAKTITIKEAFGRGADYAFPLLLVMILMTLIFLAGFILLVVPGIIFLIRYGFAPYALIHQGLRGWSALRESRELVRGYWWPVFGRLILFYAITITALFQAKILLPAVHPSIVAVVVQPFLNIFLIIYMFVIFQDLVELKRQRTSSPSGTPCTSSPSHPAGS